MNRQEALDLHRAGKYDEAERCYQSLLVETPNDYDVLHLLGVLRAQQDKHEEALSYYDAALKQYSGFAFAYANRGISLNRLSRIDEALDCYLKAVALKPDYAEAWINLGVAFQELARFEEAQEAYSVALEAKPDLPEANWNAALLQLLLGDYANGFRRYEWRWVAPKLATSKWEINRPRWLGGPVEGKTILVHAEQGLGDIIQFSRYVTELAARGAEVIVAVPSPLQQLMRGLAGASQVVTSGDQITKLDYHIPLMSLPLAFKTTVETIPAPVPYLRADPSIIARWRDRIPNSRLKVGLAWSGNPHYGDDRRRSMALETLAPVLRSDASFVCLQKDVRENDETFLRASKIIDLRQQDNFADAAAIIAQLDLVISVDTSIAHLAGAMGKPVWLMLPYVPHWPWMLNRNDSPWYPTARLFRQSAARSWDEVIKKVQDALADCCA